MSVLVLGATGRVGSNTVKHLLNANYEVHALVRNPSKLPSNPNLTHTIQASKYPSKTEISKLITKDTVAIVSAMGAMGSIFFNDCYFVLKGMKDCVEAIDEFKPDIPIKFILLSTAGVDAPNQIDKRPSWPDRYIIYACGVVANFRDNFWTADYASRVRSPFVEWCLVRPTNFVEGSEEDTNIIPYTVTEGINCSVFDNEAKTHIDNIGKFMAVLVTGGNEWSQWKGKFPFIKDTPASSLN